MFFEKVEGEPLGWKGIVCIRGRLHFLTPVMVFEGVLGFSLRLPVKRGFLLLQLHIEAVVSH